MNRYNLYVYINGKCIKCYENLGSNILSVVRKSWSTISNTTFLKISIAKDRKEIKVLKKPWWKKLLKI